MAVSHKTTQDSGERAVGMLSTVLNERLQQLLESYQVPGAALAVLFKDKLYQAGAGVLNLESGEPVTPDSLFQIGSITKAMTATLIMMLVDEGRLDPDMPVRSYLPAFDLADRDAAAAVTVRHLLNHTSGIDGDFFPCLDYDEECLARYVGAMRELEQLHPVGRGFSYCNAGYVLAGRIIEVITGQRWQTVMRERLLSPLNMEAAAVTPQELPAHGVARGHVFTDSENTDLSVLDEFYALPLSAAPAGTTLSMSAADLLEFARMHLHKGITPDGIRVLTEQSARVMQSSQVTLPAYAAAHAVAWGLGWCLYDWNGKQLYGHDGDTVGQFSFLRIEPESGTAVALLTNGGAANDLAQAIFAELFPLLAGAGLPDLPGDSAALTPDSGAYTGQYRRMERHSEIRLDANGDLQLLLSTGMDEAREYSLHAVAPHVFCYQRPPGSQPLFLQFQDFDRAGKADSLFSGYRLSRRTL